MIRLLVKTPDINNATIAANIRGIVVNKVRKSDHFDECFVDCDDSFNDRVVKWFCENNDIPFPEGTLLHYTNL